MIGHQQLDWALAGRSPRQGPLLTPPAGGSAKIAADNRNISRFDAIFAYFGLIVYCEAIGMPIRIIRDAGMPKPGESDPVVATCQTLILGILTCIFFSRWRRLLPLLRYLKAYLWIIALCLVSALWSDFPFLTIRRTATLTISVMFGVYLYQTFGLSRLCRMFEGVAVVLGVLSVVIFFVMPSIGRDSTIDDYDAVRGVFAQKNMLGECSLFGFCCCAYRFTEQRKLATFLPSAILLLGCIQLSHSASALMIALIVLVFVVMSILRVRPLIRMIYIYAFVSAVVIVAATMLFQPDVIFGAMGRDASLTGRVPLWQVIMTIIAEKPVFGHAYGGFFNADSAGLQYLWLQFPWQPPHSHSGYLDMLVDLGIVGLLAYLWLFASTIFLAFKARSSGTAPLARWVLFFMLINVLMNIDEDTSMAASLFTALMPTAMLEVGLWNARRRNAIARPRWAPGPSGLEAVQNSTS